jgi:hypothetical protein
MRRRCDATSSATQLTPGATSMRLVASHPRRTLDNASDMLHAAGDPFLPAYLV